MTAPETGGPRLPLDRGDLAALVGQEIGISPWRTVSQTEIDAFAAVTGDDQFIHVDPARAAAETPFGGTIAHGFLTLSLLSLFRREAVPPLAGQRMGVNYGFDRIRFLTPVRTGARLRGRFVLAEITPRTPDELLIRYRVSVEIEGTERPALAAEWLTLAVFDVLA